MPTLIIHSDDDQIVPIQETGLGSNRFIKHAELIGYPGASHGLRDTHKDKVNANFLTFAKN
ncbi:hypothetical protein ACXX83_21690 [Pseudomonas sp. GNP012]